MDTLDRKRVKTFFKEITAIFPVADNLCSILVTHLLPDRPFLLTATNEVAQLISVIPKPKSINPMVKGWVEQKYPIDLLSRQEIDSSDRLIELIKPRLNNRKLVLLDIGGYFSQSVQKMDAALNGSIIGIVEDTENGLQKYQSSSIAKPIISVARSPLKNPEDFLVGHSVVFSTEALLRDQGDILHGRTACLIGYGKLGRSIASLLNSKHVRTVVYDTDPIKSIEAMSHGFAVAPSLASALKGAGIVFCATGNLALKSDDFEEIEDGAYIATVTSSDDELQLVNLKEKYKISHVSDYITRYKNEFHEVYLLNRGQAVNFIHGAAVGPFIYLVQAEIIASISVLSAGDVAPGIVENGHDLRRKIASIWLKFFGQKNHIR